MSAKISESRTDRKRGKPRGRPKDRPIERTRGRMNGRISENRSDRDSGKRGSRNDRLSERIPVKSKDKPNVVLQGRSQMRFRKKPPRLPLLLLLEGLEDVPDGAPVAAVWGRQELLGEPAGQGRQGQPPLLHEAGESGQ